MQTIKTSFQKREWVSYVKKWFFPCKFIVSSGCICHTESKSINKGRDLSHPWRPQRMMMGEGAEGLSACEDVHALHPCRSLPSSQGNLVDFAMGAKP